MSGRDWADSFFLEDFDLLVLLFCFAQTGLSLFFILLLFLNYVHVLSLIRRNVHPYLLLLSSFLSGISEGALSAVQGHLDPCHDVGLGLAAVWVITDRNAIRIRVADIDRLSRLLVSVGCLACCSTAIKASHSNILVHLFSFFFLK